MKTLIYYFSGTGNSLKVAKDIAAALEDTEIVQICKNNMRDNSITADKIGFIFPVYFSGMPLLVREFIGKIKFPKEAYVFTVVTFGGTASASIDQLEKLLNFKEVKLSAEFKMKMPGNYQVMYPPQSNEKQNECFKNEKESINRIVESIKNNETVKFIGAGESVSKAVGNVIYKIFKPYEKDKNFWVDENCNGCGTCAKVCPANNIEINEGKPQWQHKCEQCVACIQWCPKKSIQYKKVTIDRGRYHHPDIKVNELFN